MKIYREYRNAALHRIPTCSISASVYIERERERALLRDDDVVNALFKEPIGLRSVASLMANEKVIRGYE